MQRYRDTDLLNFFTKKQPSNDCDGGNRTAVVGAVENSIGDVNENDLIAVCEPVSLNIVSVAHSEDLGANTTDVDHQNDFGLAVGRKLDEFRIMNSQIQLRINYNVCDACRS